MGAFEYRQAEEIRDAFAAHGVRYLFLGKSGAILLGFPRYDAGCRPVSRKDPRERARTAVAALSNARLRSRGRRSGSDRTRQGFRATQERSVRSRPGIRPDGIERFEDAWQRHVDVEGFAVCHIDDIIASKEATGRPKDRESLPRLRAFREYWLQKQ